MATVHLITFFVPLPEPLAVPDRMTVSFEEEGLSGVDPSMPVWITPGIPQDEQVAGRNFVSLKVWQQTSSMVQFQEQMRVAAKVARLETSLGQAADDEPAPHESMMTVVSAVAPLLNGDDPIADAFHLCLARINQLVSAYGMATRQSLAPVTQARLPMLITYGTRPADTTTFDGLGITELHANDVQRHVPAAPGHINHVIHFLGELEVGGPRIAYMRLSAEARRHFDRDGDAQLAVIMAETACEVLLDGLLSVLLWEEGLSPAQAATECFLASPLLGARITKYYAPRLGGSAWKLQGSGPIATWYTAVAALRNRCVHAGYTPTQDEAIAASVAERELLEFVMVALQIKQKRYPRSALIFGARKETSTDRIAVLNQFVAWQRDLSAQRSAP